jgi:hypothetical protein
VRAGEIGAAEPNSAVLRPGFPADGYWLCWMRLSHFSSVTSRQGLRILLFLFGNSY